VIGVELVGALLGDVEHDSDLGERNSLFAQPNYLSSACLDGSRVTAAGLLDT